MAPSLQKLSRLMLTSVFSTRLARTHCERFFANSPRWLCTSRTLVRLTASAFLRRQRSLPAVRPASQCESRCSVRWAGAVGTAIGNLDQGQTDKGKPRICKIGSASLRRDLYMPALSAMRHNPILKKFAERLAERGKPSKVVIVAVMRKLIVLAYRLLAEPKFRLGSR